MWSGKEEVTAEALPMLHCTCSRRYCTVACFRVLNAVLNSSFFGGERGIGIPGTGGWMSECGIRFSGLSGNFLGAYCFMILTVLYVSVKFNCFKGEQPHNKALCLHLYPTSNSIRIETVASRND